VGGGAARVNGLGARSDALEKLGTLRSDPLDLLVIGGGITGAGIALDAAARGLSVALVERGDFASGTSSKSSKLVHGGLRYLEHYDLRLIRESASERDLLSRRAPHLVEPIPFVLPMRERGGRLKFGAGLWAYDALATFRSRGVHRHLSAEATESLVPALPRGAVRGGFTYHDCKTDDVRLVMEILVAAVRLGAIVCNYANVTDLEGGASGCRARVVDAVSGDAVEVRARKIIVAAGVWTDEVEVLANPRARPRLRPSKGVHLLFSPTDLPVSHAATLIPDAERDRMLFVIPWLDAVLVGTTDTPYEGDVAAPAVDDDDRAYILDALNGAFDLELSPQHILGAFAGLRPLVDGQAEGTADLSRRHAVYDLAEGIVGITGGKLTTWRRMAACAVDRVAADLGCPRSSRTRPIRLGSSDLGALRRALEACTARLGLDGDTIGHLVRTYGDRALAVVEVARAEDHRAPLVAGHPEIAAEAVYCAAAEMVVHLGDLLCRRTRLALTDREAGVGAGSFAADALGAAQRWTDTDRREEVAALRAAIELERGTPIAGLPGGD
jgi:glycerol-3-phosphate dehydrogenase